MVAWCAEYGRPVVILYRHMEKFSLEWDIMVEKVLKM